MGKPSDAIRAEAERKLDFLRSEITTVEFVAVVNILVDAIDRAEARGAERAWQPISTAPKDGTPIFCFIPDGGDGEPLVYVLQAFFTGGAEPELLWCEAAGEQYQTYKPTHWQPLPPPPLPADEPQPGHEREGGAGERNRVKSEGKCDE